MSKKTFLLLSLLVAYVSSQAQITVNKYSSENNAVIYYLPKKTFIIEVFYSENHFTPGIYSKYAADLLGINNVSKSESTKYVINDISIKVFTEPDLNAKFVLKAPESQSKNEKDIYAVFNNLGIFCGTSNNSDYTDDFDDIVFNNMSASPEYSSFNAYSAMSSKIKIIDTIVEIISFDTLLYRMESYKYKNDTLSVEAKANLVVKKLEQIRVDRLELITGFHEIAYDAASLRYMDNRLQEMENTYLSMFIGYNSVKHHKYTFLYSPERNSINKDLNILCFSESNGVCTSQKSPSQQLSLYIHPHTDVNNADASESSKGIRYRLPVMADVTIKYNDKNMAGGIFTLPQLGNIVSLDTQRYKQILLDASTGNVKSVKIE